MRACRSATVAMERGDISDCSVCKESRVKRDCDFQLRMNAKPSPYQVDADRSQQISVGIPLSLPVTILLFTFSQSTYAYVNEFVFLQPEKSEMTAPNAL
jgi:hypothetical protein